MSFSILLFCSLCVVASGLFRDPDFSVRRAKRSYTGCYKKEDGICAIRRPENCTNSIIRMQCPRMCGVCQPFTPTCPDQFPFGCCWNGDEATDISKSNCPPCKDTSNICSRRSAVNTKCDFSSMTEKVRRMCPETCGACRDYGFEPCEDADERCAKMEDTACCEYSEILRDACKKTCGICS